MKEVQQKEIKRILLVASGSSHNACYCARSFVEKVSGLEVRTLLHIHLRIMKMILKKRLSLSGYTEWFKYKCN